MVHHAHGSINLVQAIGKVLRKAFNRCSERSRVAYERAIVFRQIAFRVDAQTDFRHLPVEE